MKSNRFLLIISLVWIFLGAIYYPKWDKAYSEATISWDVSGYYHYLPAIFIYHDVLDQNWIYEVNAKYLPSPAYDQAIGHYNSGHKVNKYAAGQAVLYAPFFLLGHAYATISDTYPADGYSKPYQVAIWLGSLLFSILGLFLLWKILRQYFEERIVTITVVALALGTHWMEYAAITNAMNHGWLLTLLCILIWSTIRFYKKPDWTAAIGIGTSLGLGILTRPTEAVWVLVPLLWGIHDMKSRYSFLWREWRKVMVAAIICGLLVSVQLIYWKYATGEWLVYTYGEQKLDWLHPKIWRGLMGVKIGWWIYTPLMFFAMFGWYGLYKKHREIFWSCFLVTILAVYITLSWSHFDSGGGLGQRNLIQIYPLLAFPLAMLFEMVFKWKYGNGIAILFVALNMYYNGWWMHQAHKGGFFVAGQMNTKFFLHTVGRLHPDQDYFKLLDTDEYYDGTPKAMNLLLDNNFESDTTFFSVDWPGGSKAKCLNADHPFYGPIDVPVVDSEEADWLRLEADFMIQAREWNVWQYTTWTVKFYLDDQEVKSNMIRLQRLVREDHTRTPVFFDVRMPDQFDRCTMMVWNQNSAGQILIDDLRISSFKE